MDAKTRITITDLTTMLAFKNNSKMETLILKDFKVFVSRKGVKIDKDNLL